MEANHSTIIIFKVLAFSNDYKNNKKLNNLFNVEIKLRNIFENIVKAKILTGKVGLMPSHQKKFIESRYERVLLSFNQIENNLR